MHLGVMLQAGPRLAMMLSSPVTPLAHAQDIVPTMPKFKIRALGIRLSLFKRTGLRVHLSDDELITVRPSLMEARLGIVFSCACLSHNVLAIALHACYCPSWQRCFADRLVP